MKGRKEFLDGERCFKLWYETSSLYKAQKILASEGVISTRTGRPPTVMGIWYAAWNWAIEHQPDAKKMVDDVFKSRGELLTDEVWKSMLDSKAKYILTEKRYQKFEEAR